MQTTEAQDNETGDNEQKTQEEEGATKIRHGP